MRRPITAYGGVKSAISQFSSSFERLVGRKYLFLICGICNDGICHSKRKLKRKSVGSGPALRRGNAAGLS